MRIPESPPSLMVFVADLKPGDVFKRKNPVNDAIYVAVNTLVSTTLCLCLGTGDEPEARWCDIPDQTPITFYPHATLSLGDPA